MNSINGLGIPQAPLQPAAASVNFASVNSGAASAAPAPAFQNLLLDSLSQVEAMQQSAQTAVEKGLSGGDITQVEVLTSMKKADLALRLMVQVRNKILDAYNEVQQLRM